MRRYGIFAVLVFTAAAAWEPSAGHAASIIWGTHEGGGATECNLYGPGGCHPLDGVCVPGIPPVDLSKGDLVQLIKAVGAIDTWFFPFPGQSIPHPDYTVDDVILDEVHVGYGLGPPGAAANGEWSRVVDVDIAVGDVLYARAFNAPKDEWGQSPFHAVGWDPLLRGVPVEFVDRPVLYLFDGVIVWVVPEPEAALLIMTGITVCLIRTRRNNN
jgi:hypothetical protein